MRLVAAIDRFIDGGGMWLELTTETDELTVADLRWSVAAPRPVPRTDIVVCTYNRADDCINTLQAMADDPEALALVGAVHVVDQGTDPLESRPRFAEVATALGDAAALRPPAQPRRRRRVHPRPLRRHRGRARGRRPTSCSWTTTCCWNPSLSSGSPRSPPAPRSPTIVGGQMLNLLHPTHLHISAPNTPTPRAGNGLPHPRAR